MTNREAIMLLQQHISIHDITESGRWENVNKAMEIAIQALEKQEPKKPILIKAGPFEHEACPNCKEGGIE